MVSVAIIGAGISGLTAAYRLRQQNVAVTLFEAAGRAGGVVRSERCEGYLVEYGPSSIEGNDPITRDLLNDLGLQAQRCTARQPTRKLAIVRNGRAQVLPLSAKTFLTSRLLSPPGKLRLLREPFIKAGNPGQEESVAAFARRRLGQEGSDYLLGTFVSSVLAGDPERFSIRHALAGLAQSEQRYGSLTRGLLAMARERRRQVATPAPGAREERSRAFSFLDGLQTLTDALFFRLRPYIHLQTAVQRLQYVDPGWIVTSRNRGQPEQARFDAVISTVPLYQLASIQFEPACDITPLSEVEYPPLSLLALGFGREQVGHSLEGTAIFVPIVEGQRLRAVLFSSSVYPARAPQGHVLLTCFIGGAWNPAPARQATGRLLASTLSELRPLLAIRGEPTFFKHIALSHSLPQYNVGYNRVLTCLERMEAGLPGFFMAGNYRQGVSLRAALLSGYETAGRLLTSLEPEPAL
jgi:oxygen-dependent protoporphyrinogen oxidase